MIKASTRHWTAETEASALSHKDVSFYTHDEGESTFPDENLYATFYIGKN